MKYSALWDPVFQMLLHTGKELYGSKKSHYGSLVKQIPLFIEPAKGALSVYKTCITVPSALIPISPLNSLDKAQYVIYSQMFRRDFFLTSLCLVVLKLYQWIRIF